MPPHTTAPPAPKSHQPVAMVRDIKGNRDVAGIMNWSRGLFRIWVAVSVLWVIYMGVFLYVRRLENPRWPYTPHGLPETWFISLAGSAFGLAGGSGKMSC